MPEYRLTDEDEVIAEFWEQHPDLPRKRIKNYSGNGTMFVTDTRCAFSDFVDYLSKSGAISSELADTVTLDWADDCPKCGR